MLELKRGQQYGSHLTNHGDLHHAGQKVFSGRLSPHVHMMCPTQAATASISTRRSKRAQRVCTGRHRKNRTGGAGDLPIQAHNCSRQIAFPGRSLCKTRAHKKCGPPPVYSDVLQHTNTALPHRTASFPESRSAPGSDELRAGKSPPEHTGRRTEQLSEQRGYAPPCSRHLRESDTHMISSYHARSRNRLRIALHISWQEAPERSQPLF